MLKKFKVFVSSMFVLALVVGTLYVFSPAASQARAEKALEEFSHENSLPHGSCVADSDGDGYASCSILIQGQHSVSLQCNSSLMSRVPLFGSSSCKVQDNSVFKVR